MAPLCCGPMGCSVGFCLLNATLLWSNGMLRTFQPLEAALLWSNGMPGRFEPLEAALLWSNGMLCMFQPLELSSDVVQWDAP